MLIKNASRLSHACITFIKGALKVGSKEEGLVLYASGTSQKISKHPISRNQKTNCISKISNYSILHYIEGFWGFGVLGF